MRSKYEGVTRERTNGETDRLIDWDITTPTGTSSWLRASLDCARKKSFLRAWDRPLLIIWGEIMKQMNQGDFMILRTRAHNFLSVSGRCSACRPLQTTRLVQHHERCVKRALKDETNEWCERNARGLSKRTYTQPHTQTERDRQTDKHTNTETETH